MGDESPKPDVQSRGANQPPAAAPILEWIRGAESHLAALQADHDRVRLLHEQQTIQLDRMQSRLTALEARVADLERADTEIAINVARLQSFATGQ